MANPLEGWKHAEKKAANPDRMLPLSEAPVWNEERQIFTVRVSRKVNDEHGRPKPPVDLKGVMFHYAGTAYECVKQINIADTALLRDLNNKFRDGAVRTFYLLELEEYDARLALIKGLRKEEGK